MGDLVPDDEGGVTVEQLETCLLRVAGPTATYDLLRYGVNKGVFQNGKFFIFKLNNKPFEHDFSTGTRDPGPPDHKAWRSTYERALAEVPGPGFGEQQASRLFELMASGSHNDACTAPEHGSFLGAFAALRKIFGMGEETQAFTFASSRWLPMKELKRLVMESVYPSYFKYADESDEPAGRDLELRKDCLAFNGYDENGMVNCEPDMIPRYKQ